PLLRIEIGLRQGRHLPCLAAAAIPVDMGIAQRDETERQIAPVEALRIPTNCNDRPVAVASSNVTHLAAKTCLRSIAEAATEPGELQSYRARNRPTLRR